MSNTPSHPAASRILPSGHFNKTCINDTVYRTLANERNRREGSPAKRQRRAGGRAAILYGPDAYQGPWSTPAPEVDDTRTNNYEYEYEYEYVDEVSSSEEVSTAVDKLGSQAVTNPEASADESSQYLGTQERDYLERTYMHVPTDLGIKLRHDIPFEDRKCYAPKRLIHSWVSTQTGHTKAITKVNFVSTGHLSLSAGADAKLLLWDVYHNVNCYAPTMDLQRALPTSTSDQTILNSYLQALTGNINTTDIPYVTRYHPLQLHEFLTGVGSKILQFDTRANMEKPTQVYDYHTAAVKTISFYDEGRRFVTSSDDRALRSWDYGIPVPMQMVADPSMFSLVRSSDHPNGTRIAYQSMNNTIVEYDAKGKIRQNWKRVLKGHNNAGQSIGLQYSPDGQFLASDDTHGSVFIWDCKRNEVVRRLAAHNGPCTSVTWHPKESSKLVSGGQFGKLRLFD